MACLAFRLEFAAQIILLHNSPCLKGAKLDTAWHVLASSHSINLVAEIEGGTLFSLLLLLLKLVHQFPLWGNTLRDLTHKRLLDVCCDLLYECCKHPTMHYEQVLHTPRSTSPLPTPTARARIRPVTKLAAFSSFTGVVFPKWQL